METQPNVMGWGSGKDPNGYNYVGHGGGSVGGVTKFVMFPQHGLIVVMVSNSSPLNCDGAKMQIARYFSIKLSLNEIMSFNR